MSGEWIVVLALVVVALPWLVAELYRARRPSPASPCEAWLVGLLDAAPAEGLGVRRARLLAASAGFTDLEFEAALEQLVARGVVTRLRGRTEPTIGAGGAP